MSFKYLRELPSPKDLISQMPLPQALLAKKKSIDKEVRDVFERKSQKFILIIGPCSADNEDALVDYCVRLAKVKEKVLDKLILIPRVYTNKPRTTGAGYKGMAHQPDPTEEPNMVNGITAIRKMHLRVIKESGFTAADEMLYPGNYPYLEDILSYVAIGARSVENQQHRLTVSGLDIPCGMKNPTSGDLTVMLNSVQAAQLSHTFAYNSWEVKTTGNELAHCILRGAVNQYGLTIPNYHYEDLQLLSQMYLKRTLENRAIIVDANHANSGKKFSEQPRICLEVMHSRRKSDQIHNMVKGLMIESYIEEGLRDASVEGYGKSITDACLGWADSEKLIYDIAEAL
ncbi:MAG: 3-deoxy-7-phosphoheptulonate synthase [Endomicrobiales bacterium]|nr:3-deoxy-7-phosphoheptulonate synthase [Endomicrobiales bacterium]